VPKSRYKSRYKSRINQEREKVFNSGIFQQTEGLTDGLNVDVVENQILQTPRPFCSMPVIKNLPFRNQKRQVKGCI